ncbi:nitrile hydratase subunit alpha [Modestobacter sp. VKM Ac-2979]|uniref:nitrile hydratase subunit alpha n=1 Tax=unclassified Modestobacter TaxID=2643866 RepID=UPI0022AB7156|nr:MULTISPECIES: nitrile hydratase subunit alpha [unclassified Modestobacter]MCZ2810277.1 nitrile hydratase subunit alpha [Modestobacter sp. VKM Ac-2979]MCZ2841763.1 nitrile hydratase subunit alpha [Modestobacter sp. VKM Ac-2980]
MSGDHGSSRISAQVRHVEALLEGRALLDAGEVDRRIDEFLAGGTPANGARIVARAWTDPGFAERLLADANAAIREVGLSMAGGLQEQRLKVVANSAETHNVVVCTLCSCYPIALLGPSPSWYKSEAYRSRVVRDPRGVLAEFGLELPAGTSIAVWDASAESRYLVLPRRPEGTASLTEAELTGLVTRKGLIGTAVV